MEVARLFSKERSNIETVNDIDDDVINLFDWIRRDPEMLAHAIRWTPYSRAVYDQAWADQYTEKDPFKRAVNFYVRMMMGHGFRTTGEKVGWKTIFKVGRWPTPPDTGARLQKPLMQAAERIRGVQIEKSRRLN